MRKHQGFTLLETIVACAVFILLAALIMQVLIATSQSTRLSVRSLEAAGQARLTLDRIGMDLAGALRRKDAFFGPGTNNANLLLFLSFVQSASGPASSPSGNRGLSSIAYRMANDPANGNRICLQRGSKALHWSDAGFAGLGADGQPVAIPTGLQPAQADFDVLASGVLRMCIGYQLYPDNQTATLANGAVIPRARGQIVYSPPMRMVNGAPAGVDAGRISSLVVALVSIDPDSLKFLSASQVADLAGAFPDPAAIDELPAHLWVPKANNADELPTTVPLPARQSLRVFQRFYPVTPFSSKYGL